MFTKKQKRINWILVAVLLVLSIFFLFPVIWMLANSFKPDAAITADMNSIAAFIPPALNGNFFDNYISIITDTNFLRYMANTLLYAAILIVLSIVVNGLAGYALAKIKFPFRDQWLMIIVMLLIVPTETVITIHFLIIAKAGLLNTIVGYILPLIVNPFNIFLFRQVFVSLPDDVYEAAQLDYCGPVKYFFTMVLPMSKTVVATVSVFTFLNVWNDYLWPSLVFTSSDLLTAQNQSELHHPKNEEMGKREVPFSRELYIEASDFMEEPPKKYFRFAVGNEVRLKGAYFVTCTDFVKDENGKVVEIHGTYDPATKSGLDFTARKVKGTVHWVNAATAVTADVNLYENLVVPDENSENGYSMNPNSLTTVKAYIEPSIKGVKPMDRFQFMRNGYFVADSKHCTEEHLVFNRIVSLKSSFKPNK